MNIPNLNLAQFEKAKGNQIILSGKKYFDLSLHSEFFFLGHNHSTFSYTLKSILKKKYQFQMLKKRI